MSDHDNWGEEEKPARDWKKVALMIGLGSLSWVATYIGMLELIQANMGDLPLTQKLVVGFAVAMLMLMIVWLLDQLFASHNLFTKLSYVAGYLFLTLISVGFGFGFYWKVLESRSEATRSAESAISQVQAGLHGASTRVSQLQTTLDGLMVISAKKAIEERKSGSSCPNSSPGDGPRRKLRDDDAARFGFASQFIKARADSINGNIKALNVDLQQVVKGAKSTFDPKTGTRNEFMRALNRKLNLTVTGFNAFRSDPQLKQIRSDLADRSTRTIFPNGKGGKFSCPDAQLQAALRGVVRAIDQLPDLQKPKITAVEGSEAVIEAFRRLTATIVGALQFKLPPTPEDLRELQQKAVQSMKTTGRQNLVNMEGAGLSKRDYIPLAIAIFVDLCLLLVSMGRQRNRLDNLVPKMRRAERGPIIQILSRFNEIHKDPEIRQNFEIFRHVVFDWGGDYYVAVPMDAPNTADRHIGGGQYERVNTDVEELRQEAHLLANLFSSFEQEKIFSRVLVPLLSTKAIQKKLHRQGSKFAGSSSFRVYKFRDGAWSEIILGAVMGAAKRVEVNKRNRQAEEDDLAANEPAFELPQPELGDTLDASDPPKLSPQEILARMEELAVQMSQQHKDAGSHEGGQAHSGEAYGASQPMQQAVATARPDEAEQEYWSEPAVKVAAIDGTAVSGFGPYSAHAAAELNSMPQSHTGAEAATNRPTSYRPIGSGSGNNGPDRPGAANNNTGPSAGPSLSMPLRFTDPAQVNKGANADVEQTQDGTANVIHLPGSVAAEASGEGARDAQGNETAQADTAQADRVNVEMRERTVTYSIPAQDAASDLPPIGREAKAAPSLLSSLQSKVSAQLDDQTATPLYFAETDEQTQPTTVERAEPAPLQPAGQQTDLVARLENRFEALGDQHDLDQHNQHQHKSEEIVEMAPIGGEWGEEASVDINTSEISRRFAPNTKED